MCHLLLLSRNNGTRAKTTSRKPKISGPMLSVRQAADGAELDRRLQRFFIVVCKGRGRKRKAVFVRERARDDGIYTFKVRIGRTAHFNSNKIFILSSKALEFNYLSSKHYKMKNVIKCIQICNTKNVIKCCKTFNFYWSLDIWQYSGEKGRQFLWRITTLLKAFLQEKRKKHYRIILFLSTNWISKSVLATKLTFLKKYLE